MSTHTVDRRPIGALGRMGVVAGLHVAALYLIASSLGIVPPLITEPPTAQLVQQLEPPADMPPTPVSARLLEPTVTMPVPVVPTEALDNHEDRIVVERTDEPIIEPEILPPVAGPVIVGVRQDPRRPLTKPAYPASDVRQGNEGKVELEIYVTPDGRIADARVLKSAGSPTLDQSAIDEAKRRWRLLPATRDGVPYAQWHRLVVAFNLADR
jgi:TonB family protein